MVFVFAHRHNKDDRFLKETEDDLAKDEDLHLDFSIVRDVMYHYSKKAQERFFTFPHESFFMAMFATSQSGKDFIKQKPDSPEKTTRLFKDINELKHQAIEGLKSNANDDQARKMCHYLLKLIEA